MKKLLNQTEAGDYIGVSRRTIYDWRRKNAGPKFFRLPGGREVTTPERCDKFISDLG